MHYDEDFYDDPSDFEAQIDEFKESLAKSVKNGFLQEMERLEKENEELRVIKESFDRIKRDYEKKKQECAMAMREAEQKAKRMKVDEFMERFKTFLWRPGCTYLYGPKCDKCDENRQIEMILPSGKKVNDDCECAKSKTKVMVPERMVRYELEDIYGMVAWYRVCEDEGNRYYALDYVWNVSAEETMVEPGTGFDVLEKKENQRDILFPTIEECLAYCEYLNKKNEVPDNIIYECNGDVCL